jgi:hypothetical protein
MIKDWQWDLMEEFMEWVNINVKIDIPIQFDDADYKENIQMLNDWMLDKMFEAWVREYKGDNMKELKYISEFDYLKEGQEFIWEGELYVKVGEKAAKVINLDDLKGETDAIQ